MLKSLVRDRERERDFFIEAVVRDVAELPDRTSPDDQPEMMMVTAEELRAIIRSNLDRE